MASKPLIVHSTNISAITMEVTLASRNQMEMPRIDAIPRYMVRIKTFVLFNFFPLEIHAPAMVHHDADSVT